MSNKKTITISEVINLMEKGYTRLKSKGNRDNRSIQQHFDLTQNEVKLLFKHPKLKGLTARSRVSFDLIDDTDKVVTSNYNSIVESPELQDNFV